MEKIHFCGGLPRSGSTVLMNILQQNPNFFTTGTCVLPQILHSEVLIKSRLYESFQAMNAEQADSAMYGLLHGATQGWFKGLTQKPIVFSKNRIWGELLHLYQDSCYIAMVRDLRDIVDSFVRYNHKIKCLHSFGDQTNSFIPAMDDDDLYHYFFKEKTALSMSLYFELPKLMNKFKRNQSKIVFIRYEDFTQEPGYILNKIHNFIEEDIFEYDLNNIKQNVMFEHDHAYFREKTSHKIESKFKIGYTPERTISEDLQKKILKENEWFYEAFYPDELD